MIKPSDHLFLRETGSMGAVLTRIFGVHNLALAEDVVKDAFCRALDLLRRERSALRFGPGTRAASKQCMDTSPRSSRSF